MVQVMTREEAQKKVQENLATINTLLNESIDFAERHKFMFGPLDGDIYKCHYFPKGITDLDGFAPWYAYGGAASLLESVQERTEHYGQWLSSSDLGDC